MRKKIVILLLIAATAGIAANPVIPDCFFTLSNGYMLAIASRSNNQEIKPTQIEVRTLLEIINDYNAATRNETLEALLTKQNEVLKTQEKRIAELERKINELAKKVK